MPIEREALKPAVFGAVEDRILELLSDGRGYYSDEILEAVKCSKDYLRIKLGELQRGGHIFSKTLPEASKNQNREANSKIYFLPQSKFISP